MKISPKLLAIAEQELTPKQLRVLKYWLAGHSYRRTAHALGISESTVRGHLDRALKRLKPHMRKEAA